VTLPLLLLPDGRLRSRRWRLAVWASVAGAFLVEVAGSLAPGQLDSWPIANPLQPLDLAVLSTGDRLGPGQPGQVLLRSRGSSSPCR
jgi:hypothetical protein